MLQKIEHPVSYFVFRDDLQALPLQGNKWRKLHLLLDMLPGGQGILTFGGAFSNHLHAVAAAGRQFRRPTVGIVRGMAADFQNPTLRFCRQCGMQLLKIPKKDFDAGFESPEVQTIIRQFPDYFHLPMGGAGEWAVRGCMSIVDEILSQLPVHLSVEKTIVAVPAGTGSTAAGILAGLAGRGEVWIFPAVARFSAQHIHRHLQNAGMPNYQNFTIFSNPAHGRFGRLPPHLLRYAEMYLSQNNILTDPIYTAKMFYQLEVMLAQQPPAGAHVVAVHTGGWQSWVGFPNAPAAFKPFISKVFFDDDITSS